MAKVGAGEKTNTTQGRRRKEKIEVLFDSLRWILAGFLTERHMFSRIINGVL